MKKSVLLIGFALLNLFAVVSCIHQQTAENRYKNLVSYSIDFQTKTNDTEIFENGVIPWVSIKNPEAQLNQLIDKDEIVVPYKKAELIIDYPLENAVSISIDAPNAKGFTRQALIGIISREYKRIYREEEQTATIKTIPLKQRKGIINRNTTNGKYGIWGHDIDDLDLSGIDVGPDDEGGVILELMVES